MSENTCHYCANAFARAELRPYGPDGQLVCFRCAMKPENMKTTEKAFSRKLADGPVVLTDNGPVSLLPKRCARRRNARDGN